jgi:hypothetical protein
VPPRDVDLAGCRVGRSLAGGESVAAAFADVEPYFLSRQHRTELLADALEALTRGARRPQRPGGSGHDSQRWRRGGAARGGRAPWRLSQALPDGS